MFYKSIVAAKLSGTNDLISSHLTQKRDMLVATCSQGSITAFSFLVLRYIKDNIQSADLLYPLFIDYLCLINIYLMPLFHIRQVFVLEKFLTSFNLWAILYIYGFFVNAECSSNKRQLGERYTKETHELYQQT